MSEFQRKPPRYPGGGLKLGAQPARTASNSVAATHLTQIPLPPHRSMNMGKTICGLSVFTNAARGVRTYSRLV
ncbi:MAG: hypothetical protein RLN70_03920, partial [Rhodospirillaceae bacterium]